MNQTFMNSTPEPVQMSGENWFSVLMTFVQNKSLKYLFQENNSLELHLVEKLLEGNSPKASCQEN